MGGVDTLHTSRRSHQAEEANARGAGTLERIDRRHRAPSGRKHRVEQKEVTFRRVARNLEVVVNRFERIVIAIQPDVPDTR